MIEVWFAEAIALLGLIAYAVFGGADFGGGIWMAFGRGHRGREQQIAIFEAMGPVWETNHVWLILVIVTLFTAFPIAFAQIFTALLIPLAIATGGIVFRGAAFAFHHYGQGPEPSVPWTAQVFSIASLLTPFIMGVSLGALVDGRITVEGLGVTSSLWTSWVRPFPLIAGCIGIAACGLLTASYMSQRTAGALREDFRLRGIIAAVVLGALTTAAIPVAALTATPFWHQLHRPAVLGIMAAAACLGIATLLALWFRQFNLGRIGAAGTVTMTIGGWGAALYPYYILPSQRFVDAAAAHGTLIAFLISLPAGSVILIPSLVLLYRVFSGPVTPH